MKGTYGEWVEICVNPHRNKLPINCPLLVMSAQITENCREWLKMLQPLNLLTSQPFGYLEGTLQTVLHVATLDILAMEHLPSAIYLHE